LKTVRKYLSTKHVAPLAILNQKKSLSFCFVFSSLVNSSFTVAVIHSVSSKIGCSAKTIQHWIRKEEINHGIREGITTNESDELKRLQHENKELKKANETLRLASAYFAKAEFDNQYQ